MDSDSLSKWSGVWSLVLVYKENLIEIDHSFNIVQHLKRLVFTVTCRIPSKEKKSKIWQDWNKCHFNTCIILQPIYSTKSTIIYIEWCSYEKTRKNTIKDGIVTVTYLLFHFKLLLWRGSKSSMNYEVLNQWLPVIVWEAHNNE